MARAPQDQIEQLAELLDQGASPEDAPSELANLLSLASSVREHTEIQAPDPIFRAELRAKLAAEAAAAHVTVWDRIRDAASARTARLRHSVRTGIATAVASGMIGSVGVAAAAQHALPGEFLYPVKQLTEDARLWFAGDQLATGRLHLDFARERLEELEEGGREFGPDRAIDTIEDMDGETTRGANDLLGAYEALGADEALVELGSFADEQTTRLSAIVETLPAEARPFARESLELLRRIEIQVDEALDPCARCDDGALTSAPGSDPAVVPPGEGPALADVDCDCVEPTSARPPRDRGQSEPSDEPAPPPGEPDDQPPSDEQPDDGDEPSDDGGLVEDLVEDPAGTVEDTVEDTVDGVEDTIDDLLEDPQGTIEDTVEDPVGTVEDLLPDPGVPTASNPSATTSPTDTSTTLDPIEDTVEDTLDPIP